MKVLILNGSSRSEGSTGRVLRNFSEILTERGHQVEYLQISVLKISPCTECLACYDREGCVIFDSMISIYEKIRESDFIIIGTPVFFSGPSAQLKAFIDRLQALWALKNKLRKKVREKPLRIAGVVVGSRGSQIDLRNTVSIFKAASNAMEGEYLDTFSLLEVEDPSDLPDRHILKEKIRHFVEKLGL
ncbi:MAG: flavodoxin family protein [Actinobacteria bacterium]|nr:flavodoxin family protein [Actinomycetota bacterium]